jgi:hypothetical protein
MHSRPANRLLLANAKRAVRNYDGSEAAFDGLIETLDAFERWVANTRPKLPPDQAERRLARRLGSTRPMSVNDMLDVAAQAYERRMTEDRIPIKREASPFVFLPSEGYRRYNFD